MRRTAALAFVLAALPGCALLRELLQASFVPPMVGAVRSEVVGADFDGLRLRCIARIDNPNALALDASSLVYTVDVKGERVAQGDLTAGTPSAWGHGGVRIPARGSAEVVIPADVPWRGGSELLRSLVMDSENSEPIPYRIAARVGIDTPVGRVLLPLEKEGTFVPPRRPKVTLVSASGRVTTSGGELLLELEVENPNTFEIPSWGLDLRATVGGKTALDIPPLVGEPLPAHGKRRVQARALVNVLAAAAGVFNVLAGTGTVDVQGALRLGGIDVPWSSSAPLGR
jgi:LEA14-like dessication related protein